MTETRMKYEAICREAEKLREQLVSRTEQLRKCQMGLRENVDFGKFPDREKQSSSRISELESEIQRLNSELKRCENSEMIEKSEEKSDHDFQTEIITEELSTAPETPATTIHSENGGIVDLLKMDKMYLKREVDSLSSRLTILVKEKCSLVDELSSVRSSRDSLQEKLLDECQRENVHFEQKLSEEIERLKETSSKELEEIRVNQRETFEREIRTLRIEKDFLSAELSKARVQIEEARAQYTELLDRHRETTAEMGTDVEKARNDLRISSFELDRATILTEEHKHHLERLKTQNERLGKKNEVLTGEYRQLQHKFSDQQSRMIELIEKKNDPPQRPPSIHRNCLSEKENVAMSSNTSYSEASAKKEPRNNALAVLTWKLRTKDVQLTQSKRFISELKEQLRRVTEELKTSTMDKEQLKSDLARMCDIQQMFSSNRNPYEKLVVNTNTKDAHMKQNASNSPLIPVDAFFQIKDDKSQPKLAFSPKRTGQDGVQRGLVADTKTSRCSPQMGLQLSAGSPKNSPPPIWFENMI
eukprot:171446_1